MLDKKLEATFKQFFSSSYSSTIDMMKIIKERKGDDSVINALSHILASNTLLFIRFAYELYITGVNLGQIESIIKETLKLVIKDPKHSTTEIMRVFETLLSNIDNKKKDTLH